MPVTAPCLVHADIALAALAASSKRQMFRLVAERVVAVVGGDVDALMSALLERERIGTTGIGGGVAVPHVKIAGLSKVHGVLACLSTPVDYEAVDGAPVDIVFMLLAPAESKTTQHLKMLAQISRFLRDEKAVAALRAATDEEAITLVVSAWADRQGQLDICPLSA